MAIVKKEKSIYSSKNAAIDSSAFLSHALSIAVSYSTERFGYSDLWKKYGLTVTGKKLHEQAGYNESNYYSVRRGNRKMNAGLLMSVCMLSKATPQTAHDVFHECKDTSELVEYGHPAAVLSYLLQDMHDPADPREHNYEEFMVYTLRLQKMFGLGIPDIFKNNLYWKNAFSKVK